MKKSTKLLISGIVIIVLLFLSLKYDYSKNSNCVTTISGLWSAAATIVLGGIAFWQNKKYKELSDASNDMFLMPEIYQSTAESDEVNAPFEQYRETIYGELNDKTDVVSSPIIHLNFMRGPILNLEVVGIKKDYETITYTSNRRSSLRDEAIPFNLVFYIPKQWITENNQFCVTLLYENIYGTKYEKEIFISLSSDVKSVLSIEFKRAQRFRDERSKKTRGKGKKRRI